MVDMNTTTNPINLRPKGGNWIAGTVGRFAVCAKVFAEGSHYGMPENDRISILQVKDSTGRAVFEYDRNDLSACDIDDADLAAIIAAVTK